MTLKDIWPMLGNGHRNEGPLKRTTRKPGVCSKGASALHKHYVRYTHLLSMWDTERNLRKQAK